MIAALDAGGKTPFGVGAGRRVTHRLKARAWRVAGLELERRRQAIVDWAWWKAPAAAWGWGKLGYIMLHPYGPFTFVVHQNRCGLGRCELAHGGATLPAFRRWAALLPCR
jgi:hypothetical protein